MDMEKSGLWRFRVNTSETSLATKNDISVHVVDGAMGRRTTSFHGGYTGMIAAHALWKQTDGVTSFECLQCLGELHYTPRATNGGFLPA